MSAWNFGQVTAVIAELARNLPTFLQANSETSASDRTRRFIHKSSTVPWYENRVRAPLNSGIDARSLNVHLSTPNRSNNCSYLHMIFVFIERLYISVMFNLRNKSALIAPFIISVKNYKNNWKLNKNPAWCNSMKCDLFYCKVTLHVSGVTAPIIRSTKNCNRSLRYRS